MRKMLFHGIAVGLLTVLLVWTIAASDHDGVYYIAKFLSGPGNNSYLWGTNFLIIAGALALGLKTVAWLAIKIDVTVLFIVQMFKLISEHIMIGTWTLRPNGSPNGFPSGHATHAFAMAFLMSYFFPRFWLLWYSVAVGISWSRIEMSAHTPLQVTAGICFGLVIGYGFLHNWLAHSQADKPCAPSVPAKIAA
jgi:membrane-associated phospholipid phosphatase